jgi:GNAT superfamily N-acetyltransferase
MELRPADRNDVDAIKWALYAALDWSPARPLPPFELVMEHPEAARYHRDWGRPGDLGVIASRDEELVGVAYCRLFTDEDHGHGYVDEATPEIAVAVHEAHRGAGIGALLLQELARLAAAEGFAQLSLSVDTDNPARRLYERLGYRELSADGEGVRMLIRLEPSVPSRE